jgi:hypothetical protein
MHAFIEFGQRDYAQGQTGRSELFEASGEGDDAVEVIDDPVGIEEITGRHILAAGRVTRKRSR